MPSASICRSAAGLRGLAFVLTTALLAACSSPPISAVKGVADTAPPAPAAKAAPPMQTAAAGATIVPPPAGSPPAAAAPAATPAAAPTPPKPPPAPVPFDEAVVNAASSVLSALPEGQRHLVVIDPLVDGVTGAQTAATRSIQGRIVSLVHERYPDIDIEPFNSAMLHEAPIVLIGTFTPVDKDAKTAGTREAFRFCLVAADLKAGKIVAKSVARALPEGVDATPLAAFDDAPVWTADKQIQSYIASCQGSKVGDPINKAYVDGILSAALVSDAIEAYNARRYADARELYEAARNSPAGDQLRVWNGLYLTNLKLGNRPQADEAFLNLVDYGLKNNRLGVKFLFRPGSTGFAYEAGSDYALWLRDIALKAEENRSCLEVTGHTSATGAASLNDRLSLLRAEYIKARLQDEVPDLGKRMIANGVGSRENLVGTGTDNAADALDRRVEFKVVPSCA